MKIYELPDTYREIFIKLGDSGLIDTRLAGCLSDLAHLGKKHSCSPVFRYQMGYVINDFISQGSKEVTTFFGYYQKSGTTNQYKTKDELRRRKDEPCKEFKKTEQ